MLTETSRPDGPITYANPTFYATTGYAPNEVLGRNPRFLQGPDTDPAHVAAIGRAIAERRPISQRILNYRKDGSPLWCDLAISPVFGATGKLRGFVSIQNDVTETVAAQAQATETRRLLEDLTDNIPGFVSRRKPSSSGEAEFLFYSQSLNRLLEVERGPSTLDEFLQYLHPDDRESLRHTVSVAEDQLNEFVFDYRLLTAKGRVVWIHGSSRPRRLANGDLVWDACCIDVSSERAAQERLAYLRNHDPLTGLPNRSRLEELLLEALRSSDAEDRLILVVVEFDEIAEVRTVLGTAPAERLVHGIAERLGRCVQEPDHLSRVGEAQFALFGRCASGDALPKMVQREFDAPLDLVEMSITVKPHLGVSQHRSSARGRPISGAALAGELLKNAQMALFEARRGSGDEAVMYGPALKAQAGKRIQLKQGLTGALALDQFQLEYQPLVDLHTLEIVGAEALVRWRHPEAGLQLPDTFIPLAEETGAIVELGEWVLRSAVDQARQWSRLREGIRVSVNVSGLQIRQPGFSTAVRDVLASAELDPGLLELELTETFLIESSRVVDENLDQLRRLGVSVAIDDFGAGYSSFQYLTRFPAQRVKIDRSLVRAIGARRHGEAVIRSVLELTRSLGLDAVFEGIETEAQLDFLRAQGARVGQGYYFARPGPPEAVETALRQQVGPSTMGLARRRERSNADGRNVREGLARRSSQVP